MNIIKFEDFPVEMTKENIDILARMMDSMPPSKDWEKIAELLTYEEEVVIWDRASEIQEEREQEHWSSLTPEEQQEKKHKIEESLNDTSNIFRGNLLQQELDSIELSKIGKDKEKKKE